ncbi:MAG: hypothetical protein V3U52_07510 [Thermoplasmata archaeon]
MTMDYVQEWTRVDDESTSLKILRKLADPTYTPVTTSELAVNELGMGGPQYNVYTQVRDQLTDLGFITYSWGEPVLLSPSFREFLNANEENWAEVLAGEAEPTAPEAPPEVPEPAVPAQPSQYPAIQEDENLWDRFNQQILPMLESEVSSTGEVLYLPTARQGSRATGGRYSRPDLTYVLVGRYPLSGAKYLDISSVEVKTWEAADDLVNAYEAIAYKRFSSEVYYAYESPSESQRISSAIEEILREEGIGIIRIWREGEDDKMRIDARPTRTPPSAIRLESHLEILSQIDERGVTRLLQSKYR